MTFRDIPLFISRPGSTVCSKINSPVLSMNMQNREQYRFVSNYLKQKRTVSTTPLVSRKWERVDKQENSIHTKNQIVSRGDGYNEYRVVTISTRVRGCLKL